MALGSQKNIRLDAHTGYSYEGKSITVSKKQGAPLKQHRHNPKWWPEDTRLEAATLWAATRNWKTVSECTKVPMSVLRHWQNEPWFKQVVSRVVKDHNDELDQKLTEVIHKASNMISERLDNGDYHLNYRTMETIRVPANIRSLSAVMSVIFDKRQLIRGEATSRTEAVTSSQKLEELKDAFLKFSQATEIEGDSNEVQQTNETSGTDGQEAPPLLEYDPTTGDPIIPAWMLDQSSGDGVGDVVSDGPEPSGEHKDSLVQDEGRVQGKV